VARRLAQPACTAGLWRGCDHGAAQSRPRGLDRDEKWLAGRCRSLVTWGSASYPLLLAAIPDAPLALFVEGTVAALSLPQLAIVGSRNPTQLGRETASSSHGT